MSRKRDLSAAVHRAASAPVDTAIKDRFEQAEATLAQRPTGYSPPTPESSAPSTFTGASSQPDQAARVALLTQRYGTPVFEQWALDGIEDNPYGARRIYLDEDVRKIASALLADGQLVPALATRREARRILIDGQTRKRGLRLNKAAHIDVLVFPNVSDQDLYLLSYKTNDNRKRHSALDDAMAWRKVLDDGVFKSESHLAEETGEDLSKVNKTLAALTLPVEVLDIIRTNPGAVGMSVLYELVQLHQVAPLAVLIEQTEKVMTGDVSRRDLTELRSRYGQPKSRKPKEVSRQYKILAPDGNQTGVIKEWDSGRVTLDITMLDAEARSRLVADLQARLAPVQAKARE
ncbi:ParB/RepB/Spo0J family partition protein [Bordetella pseudohinzii]|uniref:ParB/RepB/Spo0J family partition protein n=2 Tax=Bordetella pseudohinzii TaxID=1331258 RepID=A0A0M7HSQ0_9BORD|nr:ParB/RepB/Spo0J family partition protein [Bordetella pseudohinzii]CUJ13336.1 ParB/RepB/Spo0J family partition protein [Bordetella pseudohinzii]